MIKKVLDALKDPIKNRVEIKSLTYELCNGHIVNTNCGSCISEAVLLLSNWLRQQGHNNDYKSRAIRGEYELKKLNLFVQIYESEKPDRQKELDECLRINKELNVNGVPYFNVIEISERLTFNQMFDLTANYKDCINIIANSDIFFNETILNARFIAPSDCWALSRWDYSDGKAILFDRKDSQDVWVFNGEVKGNFGDYFLGVPGCDNRLAHDLKVNGYNVLNPSKSIHAIHLHETNYRTYTRETQAVPRPYHFVLPHYL